MIMSVWEKQSGVLLYGLIDVFTDNIQHIQFK